MVLNISQFPGSVIFYFIFHNIFYSAKCSPASNALPNHGLFYFILFKILISTVASYPSLCPGIFLPVR